MAKILDGKAVSQRIKSDIRLEVEGMTRKPGLAVVIVGDDPASQVYVRNKEKACEEIGFYSEVHRLNKETTQDELLTLVHRLNNDDKIDGILVQSPLPKGLDEKLIVDNILPEKDVDAFHPVNVGKIMIGDYDFLPCTPAGVMELIHESGIDVRGKECVVVGRSNIVGKPMAMLLLHEHGTVTICHSRTADLRAVTQRADVLVVAVGRAKMVTSDMVKEGAVVIDVGMNRTDAGLCGDVDFDGVINVAGAITPVPGGVGPMTIAMLMKNTLTAAKRKSL